MLGFDHRLLSKLNVLRTTSLALRRPLNKRDVSPRYSTVEAKESTEAEMATTIYRGKSHEERLCQDLKAAAPSQAHLIKLWGRGIEGQVGVSPVIYDSGSQQKGQSNG